MNPKSEAKSSKFKVQSSKSKSKSSRFEVQDQKPKAKSQNPNSACVYGVLPILEALRAKNRRIGKIIIADGANEKRLSDVLRLAQTNGVQIQKVPRENLERLIENEANHQGIVAFVAAAEYFDTNKLLSEINGKGKFFERNFGRRGRPAKSRRDFANGRMFRRGRRFYSRTPRRRIDRKPLPNLPQARLNMSKSPKLPM